MRMNKSIAKDIAKKMTEKLSDESKKAFEDFQQFIYEEYIKQTPLSIIEASKVYPEYFKRCTTVALNGAGFHTTEQYVIKNLVISNNIKNYYGLAILNMDNDLSVEMKECQKRYLNAEKKYEDLRAKIETALNGLKTFTQIEKHLPEAVPFLPKSTSTKMMVNFDKLRSDIKAA